MSKAGAHRVPVKVYRVHMKCICGGRLQSTGIMLTSNPAWYVHKCDSCDVTANFREIFPHLDYEERA